MLLWEAFLLQKKKIREKKNALPHANVGVHNLLFPKKYPPHPEEASALGARAVESLLEVREHVLT